MNSENNLDDMASEANETPTQENMEFNNSRFARRGKYYISPEPYIAHGPSLPIAFFMTPHYIHTHLTIKMPDLHTIVDFDTLKRATLDTYIDNMITHFSKHAQEHHVNIVLYQVLWYYHDTYNRSAKDVCLEYLCDNKEQAKDILYPFIEGHLQQVYIRRIDYALFFKGFQSALEQQKQQQKPTSELLHTLVEQELSQEIVQQKVSDRAMVEQETFFDLDSYIQKCITPIRPAKYNIKRNTLCNISVVCKNMSIN
jgi:hypothetical protein